MKTNTRINTLGLFATAIMLFLGINSGMTAQPVNPTLLSYHTSEFPVSRTNPEIVLASSQLQKMHESMMASLARRIERLKAEFGNLGRTRIVESLAPIELSSSVPTLEPWMVDESGWNLNENLVQEENYTLESWMTTPFEVTSSAKENETAETLESWMVETESWTGI